MKKPILTLFIILLSLGLKISAQTNTEKNTESKKIADDFPVYVNTGNPELDGASYDKAKREWVAKNEDKYLNMNGVLNIDSIIVVRDEEIATQTQDVKSQPTVFTQEKFQQLSVSRQKYVLEHPELFKVEN